jgi:hypothetical protein
MGPFILGRTTAARTRLKKKSVCAKKKKISKRLSVIHSLSIPVGHTKKDLTLWRLGFRATSAAIIVDEGNPPRLIPAAVSSPVRADSGAV